MSYCGRSVYKPLAISCVFKPVIVVKLKSWERVIKAVCDETSISVDLIKSPNRSNDVSEARFIAIHLIKTYIPSLSLSGLGSIFNRDHSTMIYALKQVEDWLIVNKRFKSKYMVIENTYRKAERRAA